MHNPARSDYTTLESTASCDSRERIAAESNFFDLTFQQGLLKQTAYCRSQGTTEQEAIQNIQDAIREYLTTVEDETRGQEVREIEVAV